MLVNAYIENGVLMIGEKNGKQLPYYTTEISMSEEVLEIYEAKQTIESTVDNKKYIKDAIKLKEAGFTADEIIELIGAR